MAVYVLRNQTLSGSGDIKVQRQITLEADDFPPETPESDSVSTGSLSITGAGSFSFASFDRAVGVPPLPVKDSQDVGWEITVTDPLGGSTTDEEFQNYNLTGDFLDVFRNISGSWSASIDCELCLEVTDPAIPSGTGSSAVNYNPDPPHGRTYRLFFRRRNGGAWSISCSIGSKTVSRSGTFSNNTEIGCPDSIISTVESVGTQQVGHAAFTVEQKITGTWRGALIGTEISASGSGASAAADNTVGVQAIASVTNDPIGDSSNAYATRSLAVPLVFDLDAQLRAMEVGYPDSLTLEYQRAGTTVDETATGSFADNGRTYRSESSEVWVNYNNTTYEDRETYSHPSNWGPISIGIKSSSATSNNEPTSDLKLLLKDRKMNALSVETPESTANLTGSDSAFAGSPWGVQRSYTGLANGWQGLMGWRYLEVIIAETGGASSGAAVTIKIGSKSWTKDKDGTALTAPGSGNSRTWYIDLCSPSSESVTTDTCDTTYPYDGDWSALGGGEDNYYRTGTGPYSGVNRATSIRIEVGSSRTFTITSIKGWRVIAETVRSTNLPTHNGWIEQRPATVVSEADTTTYHKVRQSYEVDLDGRLITAEWSDTEFETTVGGVSGVYTHTLYQRSLKWLVDRINAVSICPGWSATIIAPVSGTGSQEWYNRDREMHGLLGGGYYWSSGAWVSGIDIAQRTQAGGAQTLLWQGGFTELTNCPGDVGDVFEHDTGATTGTLELKAAKMLRSQGIGLSLTTAGLSKDASTLTLTQGTAKGTGTSGTNGYAQTGSPFGNGNGGDFTLDFDGGDTGTYAAKARKRRHFRSKTVEVSTGGCLRLCISPSDRLTRGYFDGTPSVMILGFSNTPVANDWVDYETTLQTEDFWIDYTTTGSTTLVVAYVAGGDVKRTTTSDEGETFSVATTIFTGGEHPAFVISPTGVEYHFAWFTGGIIKTRVFDAQGTEMIAVTNVVGSGADDDQIAVEWREGWVVLAYAASGTITTVKSQDGVTYS